MTQNKQFKLEVRRYAEEHGLAYADARRRILAARSETAEDVTVVPSEYCNGLLADIEAQDERNERVAAARRRLGGVVQQAGSDEDLVKVRLSEGTYILPGVSIEELGSLRPTLDAMNAPSSDQDSE